MDFLIGAIDHRFADFCALCVWGGEIPHVLRGEIGIETSDKDRGAHNLCKAGRVML
jgi:hypothetical protein